MKTNAFKPLAAAAAALLVLSACGGGSGGGNTSSPSGGGTVSGGGTAGGVASGGSGSSGGSVSGGGSGVVVPPSAAASRIEPMDTSAAVSSSGTAQSSAVAKDAAAASAQGIAPSAVVRRVQLGALAQPSIAKDTAANPAQGIVRQIGTVRSVADTATVASTQSLLQWVPTDHGTQVAAIAFDSSGAYGVRLGVLVRGLPAGAVLRFYGANPAAAVQVSAQDLAAIAARNAQGGADDATARTYWSPDFGSASTTLEVEIPAAAAASSVQIAVPRLSHFTVAPDAAEGGFTTKVGESGSCEVDVMCKPEYSSESRSVARMIFVHDDGNAFLCTGTLLNDARSSGTPYFLSANHCISTQSVASTLTTDWFYRSTACNSGIQNPGALRLNGGATLLFATATTDTSFLRLNSQPPVGVVYAGSYYGGVPVQMGVAGVHHPKGDLQKVSVGTVQFYSNCSTDTCQSSTPDNGNFISTNWQQGTTEGGSSGSALFVGIGSRRYVSGQLLGGSTSCSNPGGIDQYGRFDQPYRSNLKQWLNP